MRTRIALLVVALLAGGCAYDDPTGLPFIDDQATFEEVNLNAEDLTRGPVEKFYRGEELSNEDRSNLIAAVDKWRALLAYDAQRLNGYFGVGQCKVVLGQYDEAVRYLQTGLNAVPNDLPENDPGRPLVGESMHLLSIAYYGLGKYDRAAMAANAAQGLYPKAPAYLAAEADALVKLNKLVEAKELAEEALAINPNEKKAKRVLGQIPFK